MKVKVAKVNSFNGPAYQYRGDDGFPAAVIIPVLTVKGEDGKLYQLPNQVTVGFDDEGFQIVRLRFTLTKAHEIQDKIFNQGFIESDHWVELTETDLREYLSASYGVPM